ncbi:hypothetical protein [Natrinema halophilum]|nr:hypothetical protein [Natrinema halophilum]
MAASNPPLRPSSTNAATDSGVGMAHLTVVPTNFDPDDSNESDE